MFSSGCNYNKLKANLQLAMQRFKLLEKKKTEMAIKSRREIADYLAANKPDRARIRVETIIREENTVEAMELLEMFCDLLVARAGLMKAQAGLDPGLEEAVCSLIWAAPRMEAEVLELKIIAEQLRYKYGREYFEAAACNQLQKVNPKLLKKMAVEPPEKRIVELYLVEIARSFSVPFTPDSTALSVPTAPLIIDGIVVPAPPPGPPGMIFPNGGQPTPMQPMQPMQQMPPLPTQQPQPTQPAPFTPPAGSQQFGTSDFNGGFPQQPQQGGNQQFPQSGGTPSNNAPGYQPNSYPGSSSAPVYTTLPPPYQAPQGDNKVLPPGWASASGDSNTKPPIPTDPVNPSPNVYPTSNDHNDNFNYGGLPSVPPAAPSTGAASGQQPSSQPPVDDSSLDDLERRFEELRRKQ